MPWTIGSKNGPYEITGLVSGAASPTATVRCTSCGYMRTLTRMSWTRLQTCKRCKCATTLSPEQDDPNSKMLEWPLPYNRALYLTGAPDPEGNLSTLTIFVHRVGFPPPSNILFYSAPLPNFDPEGRRKFVRYTGDLFEKRAAKQTPLAGRCGSATLRYNRILERLLIALLADPEPIPLEDKVKSILRTLRPVRHLVHLTPQSPLVAKFRPRPGAVRVETDSTQPAPDDGDWPCAPVPREYVRYLLSGDEVDLPERAKQDHLEKLMFHYLTFSNDSLPEFFPGSQTVWFRKNVPWTYVYVRSGATQRSDPLAPMASGAYLDLADDAET